MFGVGATTLDAELAGLGLDRREDGIWFARTTTAISYPEDGNAACLEVEDGSFWFRHRNRCIASLAARFRPDGPFLDVGGGNGYVAKALVEAGLRCILVEPGQAGAVAARARGIDPVICASLGDAGFPPASVAAAGMFDVLEHIEDEAGALGELRRVIVPGGRLFITVPAYRFLTSYDDEAAGHFRRYTRASLTAAVTAAGFGVAYSSYMFAPLPPAVFVARTLPTWLGSRNVAATKDSAAHHKAEGIAAWVVNRLLDAEFSRIDAGGAIPFGTSCVCVATRN